MNDEERGGIGEVFTSTLCSAVPLLAPGRESFCADVSFYIGPLPGNPIAFIDGSPTFAVEIRDKADQEPEGEIAMAAKRLDDFEAGTRVVWHVDAEAELIHAYRSADPTHPTTFARGQIADAEPAVPGRRTGVDDVFGPIATA